MYKGFCGTDYRRFQLDMPDNSIALNDNIIPGGVYFSFQNLRPLIKLEPHFLKHF